MDNKWSGRLTQIGIDDYTDATDATGVVVIGMGAPWCGPWRAFLPVFADVAEEFGGIEGISFMTCDLQTNAAIAVLEDISHIPAVLIYRDGRRAARIVGAMTRPELSSTIATIIDGDA